MKIKKIAIFLFFLNFALLPRDVFALAAPTEDVYRCINFRSSQCDQSRSNVERKTDAIILKQESENKFFSSGICWTGDLYFSRHIYSVTPSGVYYEPNGSEVKIFASFGNEIEEYPLAWQVEYQPKQIASKMRLKIFLATRDTSISPSVKEVCLKVKIQDRSENGIKNRDSTRVSELKRVRDALARYYSDFGHYPVVSADVGDKEQQWNLLKTILDSASLTYRKSYNSGFVSQPAGVDSDYQYGYLTGSSGLYYLLWTKLENSSSDYFKESWMGKVLDVDCSAPIFCLYSKANQSKETLLKDFGDKNQNNKIQGAEFVKVKDDPRVWLKFKNQRLWLRTPEIFTQAGGEWNKIKIEKTLDNIPILKFIKEKNKDDIYLITESGFKRALPNSRILNLYGKSADILVADDSKIINLLPENRLIRAKGDDKVYFLEQKIKRWITSPEVFEKMGFDWLEVVEIDPEEMNYYPEATPMF